MYYLFRWLLFLLPAETAHLVALRILGWFYRPSLVRYLRSRQRQAPLQLFGLSFNNPVGLAAGLDKNGDYIDALFGLGFGFIEVGCVTPRAQPGNAKPRLFRLPRFQALVNCMGFNNRGLDYLVERLSQRTVPGVVGVNIGKNKNTPAHLAVQDYLLCHQKLFPYADFITINISSPNTPGLRQLATPRFLQELLAALKLQQAELTKTWQRQVPILLKLTVDFSPQQLQELIEVAQQYQVAGVVMSNTTVDFGDLPSRLATRFRGGLSGAPLRARVTQSIQFLKQIAPDLPVIGVGGVLTPSDAMAHWQAGADLIEVYTGLIYHGPKLIKGILRVLQAQS